MKVEVRCPSCEKIGFINMSNNEFTDVNRGLLAINITEKIICNHSFIIYVDKNLIVRDCFIADFHIKIPELESSEELDEDTILEVNKIDLVILKLNFSASLLAYILRCIFLNKKLVLLSNERFLYCHIKSIINYITIDNFNYTIEILQSNEFIQKMENYRDYIILEGNKIVQDKENIINKKILKVERTIIEKFLLEGDNLSSILLLRNEIEKAYKLAKSVEDFVKIHKEKNIQSKEILDYISKKYRIEITLNYLNFLIEIVENSFKIKVPKSSDVSNFLGLL
ncbi:MAG: hypothetical protein KGD63_14530 [Candidatus Lokiarchaeota archaeon]|nr:hypothetical protein [Candidatus Lokiarchaeota archaeon]